MGAKGTTLRGLILPEASRVGKAGFWKMALPAWIRWFPVCPFPCGPCLRQYRRYRWTGRRPGQAGAGNAAS